MDFFLLVALSICQAWDLLSDVFIYIYIYISFISFHHLCIFGKIDKYIGDVN